MRVTIMATMVALSMAAVAGAQQVTKQTVPGVTNFSKVETTIACAGATTPAGVAEVKKLGYHAIINLRPTSTPRSRRRRRRASATSACRSTPRRPIPRWSRSSSPR